MSYRAILIWLSLAVAGLFLASLLIGPSGIGPLEGLRALFTGEGAPGLVMRELRLPRALLGVGVGAALGLSGAAMQGFLRNPLAEPGLIGTSAGAALGAVIAIQTGLYAAFALALPFAALAGAGLGGVASGSGCSVLGLAAPGPLGSHFSKLSAAFSSASSPSDFFEVSFLRSRTELAASSRPLSLAASSIAEENSRAMALALAVIRPS
jgi:hypothetical protein